MSAHLEASPFYFLGRLSMAVSCAIKAKDANAGREALDEFMASPIPTPELKAMLREELKR
jgi:hypothetical protein